MSDHVSPQSDAALEVRRLSIKLPSGADREMAVDGVSFIVPKGKTLCIVGESGSGKSMIANAVIGLLPPHLRPTNGQILLAGQNILNLAEKELRCIRGERIGMIFQEPMTALNPLMRIGDQIGEVFDAHVSIDKNEKRQRILRALTDVGLPDPAHLVDSFPFRLSGGQRQRVMIAGALALEPALLIADEPTTALDVTTQAQILQLIRDLQSRRGTAVLFITHDFGVVSQIADEVVVMNAGIPVEVGPCSQVLATPRHEYTKRLIAAIPNGPHRYRQAQPKEQPLLEVESLCKTFRSGGSLLKKNRVVQAAKNISFTLQRGDTLGIVGESGSGKSTLGRCLVGLSEFDGGKILFDGKELRSGRAFRKDSAGKVQMVFQDPYASLNPRHLVGDAIAEGPIAQGIHVTVATKRAAELLQLVGLTPDAARRYPHEFSGGQRQRIGIARALSTEPQLLIADEPVSALDVRVQAQVLGLFLDIQKRLNLAMVFITHDLRVAGALCDRIAVMKKGEIVEYGDTRSVLGNPQHPYTKDLIAAVPKLHRSG